MPNRFEHGAMERRGLAFHNVSDLISSARTAAIHMQELLGPVSVRHYAVLW